MCVYPLLGGLVAEVQGGGVPVHSNISVSHRGSVLCALYCAASAEPANTHTHKQLVGLGLLVNLLILVQFPQVYKVFYDASYLYQGHQAQELPSLPTTRKVKGYW